MLYDVNMTGVVTEMHDYMVIHYILLVCMCCDYWWIVIKKGKLLLCANACYLWLEGGP